jgi:hypothetical protein
VCVGRGLLRYFEQYGVCARCPTAQSPESVLATVGFPLLLAAVVGTLVALRAMMARGMMKVSHGYSGRHTNRGSVRPGRATSAQARYFFTWQDVASCVVVLIEG